MPHDAAIFAASVKQRKTPDQTEAAEIAADQAARVKYNSSRDQAVEDYSELTALLPQITTLSPTTKVAGAALFTLTVNGYDFDAGAKIRWSGTQQTTTVVSKTQLTCSISAAKVATAGNFTVTVINGSGKISNGVVFPVTA